MATSRSTVRSIRKEIGAIAGSWKRPVYCQPKDFIEAVFGFQLDKWQRTYVLEAFKQPRVSIVASRQSGKSTVVAGIASWALIYLEGFQCVVTSKTQRQAAHFLKKVKYALTRLLPASQIMVNSKTEVELGNGSLIAALPSKDVESVRGYSPDLVILDEAAFAPDDLLTAISPSLAATHGALHMISSPNGPQGIFHRAVEGSEKDLYWSLKVTADQCKRIKPEYLEEQKRILGDIFYRQEFWCEFLSPIGSFFDGESLTGLFGSEEEPYLDDIEDLDPLDGLFVTANRDDVRNALDSRDRVNRLLYDS